MGLSGVGVEVGVNVDMQLEGAEGVEGNNSHGPGEASSGSDPVVQGISGKAARGVNTGYDGNNGLAWLCLAAPACCYTEALSGGEEGVQY